MSLFPHDPRCAMGTDRGGLLDFVSAHSAKPAGLVDECSNENDEEANP